MARCLLYFSQPSNTPLKMKPNTTKYIPQKTNIKPRGIAERGKRKKIVSLSVLPPIIQDKIPNARKILPEIIIFFKLIILTSCTTLSKKQLILLVTFKTKSPHNKFMR